MLAKKNNFFFSREKIFFRNKKIFLAQKNKKDYELCRVFFRISIQSLTKAQIKYL